MDPNDFQDWQEAGGAIVRRNQKTANQWDFEVDVEKEAGQGERAVTPHHLFAYTSCRLKGDFAIMRVGKLGLSSWTQRFVEDGRQFESVVIEGAPDYWLRKFNKLFGCNLNVNQLQRQNVSRVFHLSRMKMYTEENQKKVREHIRAISCTPVPFVLTQIPLCISTEQAQKLFDIQLPMRGILDVAIWTGHCWILGEVKCTERALTNYCIQVEFYCRLWESIFPQLALHDRAFLITCLPGFAFSLWETEKRRKLALANLVLEAIERQMLKIPFEENLQKVREFENKPNLGCRLFQARCVECEFRCNCYPVFLGETTDIGLLPLTEAAVRRLKEEGCETIEQLLEQGEKNQVLKDVCSGTESINLWLRRASLVRQYGGYSGWRPLPEWRDNFWVAGNPTEYVEDKNKTRWWTPAGETQECPMGPYPKVIFTYTGAEKRRIHILISNAIHDRKEEPKDAPVIIALQGELRNWVHFPYGAFTIKSVCALLEGITTGKHAREMLKEWLVSTRAHLNKQVLPDDAMDGTRLEAIARLAKALMDISDLCREEHHAPSLPTST